MGIRFTVIKSVRLMWKGHIARMREGKGGFKILTSKPKERMPVSSTW